MSLTKSYNSGFANSGTAGYFMGGSTLGGANNYSTIDKLAFSNDTVSSAGNSGLGPYPAMGAAMANSGTAGYMAATQGPAGGTSQIEKLTFSNDSKSIISATLSAARYGSAGMASSGTAGYFSGGSTAGSNVDKSTFSNDTRALH